MGDVRTDEHAKWVALDEVVAGEKQVTTEEVGPREDERRNQDESKYRQSQRTGCLPPGLAGGPVGGLQLGLVNQQGQGRGHFPCTGSQMSKLCLVT